jgi:hypothetical protein
MPEYDSAAAHHSGHLDGVILYMGNVMGGID